MGKDDRKKKRRGERVDHGCKDSERVRSKARRDRSEDIEDKKEGNRDYKVIKEKDHHDRGRWVIKESGRDRVREKAKGKDRDDKEKSSYGERDKLSGRNHDEGRDRVKDGKKGFQQEKIEWASSYFDLEERILKMKEERLKKNKSNVISWVSKSFKIEEKEKALHLSKVFEEQDNIDQGASEDDEDSNQHLLLKNLAGVKVLHGLERVVEGGAVVLTLKDQNILADGGINEEVDMLENVEIGGQKRRDQAYKDTKKKTEIYEDKFSNDVGSEKKMLPQYDDLVEDEYVTLDDSGRFTGEAGRKLEELHKRIQGVSTSSRFEDLHSSGKVSSDYYTQEEMLPFKKPKKKKSMRKKEKLDLDALEAEAISAGLGVGDLGSRNDVKMQSSKAEEEKSKVKMRNVAYQSAYAKAEESAKALKQEQFLTAQVGRDENAVFGDNGDDLYKSLERAKKIALNKQDKVVTSGPQVVSSLALAANSKSAGIQTATTNKETREEKIVFTEIEEFVWSLQLNEKCYKPDGEDVFVDEDEVSDSSDQERKAEVQLKVQDTNEDEHVDNEMKEVVLVETIHHEVRVGKGLSGALQLLKDRGMLKETVNWGGRNMDNKKSKLVGIYENYGIKEIHIERKDEFGRTMTPKEAYRRLSHVFHGKGRGKMKQEKRLKQHQEELKLMQMKNSDTPSQLMERMREAQARLKLPCIVLIGHVKQGQTSDTIRGFTTVEDLPGGLTPTLGGSKHEHFLGIKRKADLTSVGPSKKPNT